MTHGSNGSPSRRKKAGKFQSTGSGPRTGRITTAASEWETVQACINSDWETQGLATIHLLQRQRNALGQFRLARFLVDVQDDGLKEASLDLGVPPNTMDLIVETSQKHRVAVTPCPTDLVHQLVLGGIVWARLQETRIPAEALSTVDAVWGKMPDLGDSQLGMFGQRADPRVPVDGDLPLPSQKRAKAKSASKARRRVGRSRQMTGAIIPFHELLPDVKDGLTLMVEGDHDVPDGTYGFYEGYCGDIDCDCRIIYLFGVSVRRPQSILASITLGFESETFYREWIGGGPDDWVQSLKGPDLMAMAPQSSIAAGLLRLVSPYLDERRLNRFKQHYFLFKRVLAQQSGAPE